MRATLCAAMLSLATTTAAHAETGFEFYQRCTASQNNPNYFQEIAFCQGFLSGIFIVGTGFCTTGMVQIGTERLVVLNYIRTHPQDSAMDAAAVVLRAYAAAWPCKP